MEEWWASLPAGRSLTAMHEAAIARARTLINDADALVITAGAGMGVDSGLPDFRGNEGFWRAYPPIAKLGLSFAEMANPAWFFNDPKLAWGFYGHRLALYRRTTPHPGFEILLRMARSKPLGSFVYTSNVDGAFQKAGFDPNRVVECHGAIDFAQCTRDCGVGVYPMGEAPHVDMDTLRARGPLPACPKCGALARPNILMFGDHQWDDARTDAQRDRLDAWLGRLAGMRIVAVECGGGTAVPSVRAFSEGMTYRFGAKLVRINVREPQVEPGHVPIPMGALAALRAIAGDDAA